MIYLDNCATTRVDSEVLRVFDEFSDRNYFNPSSLHRWASEVGKQIEIARSRIADILNCDKKEIVFTSGGTEADNTILFGAIKRQKGKILASEGEHSAVYRCVLELRNRGYETEFLKLNPDGTVNFEDLKEKMTPDTQLVSILHVNNETGAVNDIRSLCNYVKSVNPECLFMSDGVQSFCKIETDVKKLGVDFYTFSAHKIHGPKGVGGFYAKHNLSPLIYGGGQENGRRSGTENTAGIISFGYAAMKAAGLREECAVRYESYRNQILKRLQASGLGFKIFASEKYAPNILTVALKNIRAEVLMRMLEEEEIIVGIGSACSSKHGRDRVMKALRCEKDYIDGVIRISFSKYLSVEDIVFFLEKFIEKAKLLSALVAKK